MNPAATPPDTGQPPIFRARAALLKRMADVVCLPSSRVNAFERAMTADLLVDMLREAEPQDRLKVARRLANLSEIPASLVRLLLRDHVEIAEALLTNCASLSDSDLLDCARSAGLEHRRLIAMRRGVSEVVCEVLIEFGEALVIECLLKNDLAKLSNPCVEAIVASTRGDARTAPTLLRRPELRPAHAFVLFWWADAEARRTRLAGISERLASRRATFRRSSGSASRSMSTRRSAVMARSKAFTRDEGRQTTSAIRLSKAARARNGVGCPVSGGVAAGFMMDDHIIAALTGRFHVT